MGDCFNENLLGILSTLWYKINERANCYYIHEPLNIVHIEGNDRVTDQNYLNVKWVLFPVKQFLQQMLFYMH